MKIRVQQRSFAGAVRLAAGRPQRSSAAGRESSSLKQWLASTARRRWKLGWWNDEGAFAKAAKAEARTRYGIDEPTKFLNCVKNQCQPGDWLLHFKREGGRSATWMYVDFVRKVTPSDKRAYERDYPYQAVQVHTARYYPSPPFTLDSPARAAIAAAVKTSKRSGLRNYSTSAFQNTSNGF